MRGALDEAAVTGAPGSKLLERGGELDQLVEALASARGRGEGGACLVEGAAGIGKTSLLQACSASGSAEGFRILASRASPLEAGFAFGVARQLLEVALAKAHAAERRRLLQGAAASAASLLPDWAPRQDAVGDTQAEEMQLALYVATVRLATARPLLVLVDDVHWCDEPSLRFLAFLARRASCWPIVLVLASRPAGEWAAPALHASFVREPCIRRLRPRPLSPSAVEDLLLETTGTTGDQAFAQACWRQTGGNPFYVHELLRELAEAGLAPVEANVARVETVGPEAVVLSVRERLERLGPAACDVARAVAVLGDGYPFAWVADLAGRSADATVEASDALRAASVLSAASELCFVHPIVRSAVYESIPPGVRDLMHLRAARVAQAGGASAEVSASHLLRAKGLSSDEGVDTLAAAAAHAVARGAPGVAADFLRRAVELPAGETRRLRLLLDLGRAEALARMPDATAHLEEALAESPDPEQRALAALALWSSDSFDGRVAEGLDLLRRAIAGAAAAPPELLCRLQLELARATRSWRPTASEGRALIGVLAAGTGSGAGELDRFALALAAYDAMLANEPVDKVIATAEGALPLSDDLLDRSGSQLPYVPVYTFIWCGQLARARELLRKMAMRAERRGSAIGAAAANLWGCLAALRSGELAECERLGTAALAQSIDRSWHFGKAGAQLFLAEAALERGDVAAAGRFHHAIGELLRPDLDGKGWADHMLHGRALWKLAAGNPKAALDELLEVGRRHDEWLAHCPSELPWRSDAALAARQVGDHAQAQRLAAEELDLARDFGAGRALGVSLRVSGLVAGSEALLREAVEVLVCSPARLELARARVELGSHLRREGRDREAREHLDAGLAEARALGAAALATRGARELRAAGGRPGAAPSPDDASLSASELRVVRFAAHGMSNPEIARALYVSRRTVETHLYNAYRKLGIRSRMELSGALTA